MEAARELMQKERAERLKAIQLEVGGDEVSHLENYFRTSIFLNSSNLQDEVDNFLKKARKECY